MNDRIEAFGKYWDTFEYGIDSKGVTFRDALYELLLEIARDAYLEGCLNQRSPRIIYEKDLEEFKEYISNNFKKLADN